MATLITFLVSAFGHELVMGCITKKLRGYGFLAQMLQLPIVALQRTKFVRGRTLFNVSTSSQQQHLTQVLESPQPRLIFNAEYMFLDLDDPRPFSRETSP